MQLYERLSPNGRHAAEDGDAFAEIKNTIHLSVISELGPQLVEVGQRGRARKAGSRRDRAAARDRGRPLARRSRAARERDRRRHPRARPLERLLKDETVTEIMVNGRTTSGSSARPALRTTCASSTTRTCAASSRGSSRKSAVGSTSRRRWSTPGCRTAAVSTRSSRRCRSGARSSRSASSPPSG